MKKGQQKNLSKTNEDFSFDILNKSNTVASFTECTGLIQIPPQNEDEENSYTDIYVIPKHIQ